MTAINNAGTVARAVYNTSFANSMGWMLTGSAVTLTALAAYMYKEGMFFPRIDTPESSFSDMRVTPEVKERLKAVYKYVIGALGITAGAAIVAHITGLSRIILQSRLAVFGTFIGAIGTMVVTMYAEPNSDRQKTMWAIFASAMGLMISPICFLDKTIIGQAAAITLGLGSILTYVAYNAEDKRLMKWEGTLLSGLTAMTVVSFVAWVFRSKALMYGMDRLSLYVGFAMFCGLFTISSQKILDASQRSVDYEEPMKEFNAINLSLGLYLDTLNLFIRILRMLNENKNRD